MISIGDKGDVLRVKYQRMAVNGAGMAALGRFTVVKLRGESEAGMKVMETEESITKKLGDVMLGARNSQLTGRNPELFEAISKKAMSFVVESDPNKREEIKKTFKDSLEKSCWQNIDYNLAETARENSIKTKPGFAEYSGMIQGFMSQARDRKNFNFSHKIFKGRSHSRGGFIEQYRLFLTSLFPEMKAEFYLLDVARNQSNSETKKGFAGVALGVAFMIDFVVVGDGQDGRGLEKYLIK